MSLPYSEWLLDVQVPNTEPAEHPRRRLWTPKKMFLRPETGCLYSFKECFPN